LETGQDRDTVTIERNFARLKHDVLFCVYKVNLVLETHW